MDKVSARLAVKKRISALSDKSARSAKIVDTIINLREIAASKAVGVYFALENEVNLDKFIDWAMENSKTVCAPKCDGNDMAFYRIDSVGGVNYGLFNVREPIGEEEIRPDLIIVPMVAYDSEKNRLGHGKGYYDKYLAGKNAYKIGVAFEAQREEFASEAHDMKMDIIVTEAGVYR